MKIKVLSLIPVCALLVILSGCAKWENEVAADGGVWGSHPGDYVVRNDSGGRIMDVWVLHNVMVQSDEHGAGWLFRDNTGNVIHLGGDLKVIRVQDPKMLLAYHEYHSEFDTKTYQERYAVLLEQEVRTP